MPIATIGAITIDDFRGFMTIDSGTSSEVFYAFVAQQLVPNLRPGDIIVMDNLAAHKNKKTAEAIRAVGADILFTPPYSSEFNPIEIFEPHNCQIDDKPRHLVELCLKEPLTVSPNRC